MASSPGRAMKKSDMVVHQVVIPMPASKNHKARVRSLRPTPRTTTTPDIKAIAATRNIRILTNCIRTNLRLV